jgi:hypothetical protein
VGEHIHDRGIEPVHNQRQELRPQAIAQDGHIRVGLVVQIRDLPGFEVLAELVTAAVEDRPHNRAVARVDSGEAFRSGAADKAQQKRLRLIVACVAQGDNVRAEPDPRALEELVARLVAGHFNGSPPAPGARRNILTIHGKRHGQGSGDRCRELFVACSVRPELMVEVRDTHQAQFTGRCELAEEHGERH